MAFVMALSMCVVSAKSAHGAEPTPPDGAGAASSPTVSVTSTSSNDRSVTQILGLTSGTDGGLGLSVLTNVTRLFFNGNYDILSAGIGLGLSWKSPSASRFPFELGLYVAPQFSGESSSSTGSVALILHAVAFKGFGLGVGGAAWQKGTGFGGGSASERLFLTIGYGLTNDTAGGPHS